MDEQLQKVFHTVSLDVNAEKQTINLKLLPKGEDKPILFHVNYKLEEKDDGTEIIAQNVATDRIWIDEVIKLLQDNYNFQFKIPQNLSGIIKMFLK